MEVSILASLVYSAFGIHSPDEIAAIQRATISTFIGSYAYYNVFKTIKDGIPLSEKAYRYFAYETMSLIAINLTSNYWESAIPLVVKTGASIMAILGSYAVRNKTNRILHQGATLGYIAQRRLKENNLATFISNGHGTLEKLNPAMQTLLSKNIEGFDRHGIETEGWEIKTSADASCIAINERDPQEVVLEVWCNGTMVRKMRLGKQPIMNMEREVTGFLYQVLDANYQSPIDRVKNKAK